MEISKEAIFESVLSRVMSDIAFDWEDIKASRKVDKDYETISFQIHTKGSKNISFSISDFVIDGENKKEG